MRLFSQRELRDALAHARDGGQALHLHRIAGYGAPTVFRRALARGEHIAHLFDQDRARLERTARALGVRVIVVEYPGMLAQHVDLCGGPLDRAVAMCPEEGRHAAPA